jgi:hypothetical protein
MGASRRSLTYGSLAASRSSRSLATSASSTTGALWGCSSATRRARMPTTFLTQGHSMCARRSVRRRTRMGMRQSGVRRLDSDVRQLHRRVRPLQGSRGSRQFSSTEHVYPSLRASTDLSTTLSNHEVGCNEVFVHPMHSSVDGHPSGTSTSTPARVEHNSVEFATPLSHDEERIDAYHDGEPLRYRTMKNLLNDQPVPGLVPHDLEAQLHLAYDDGEPRSFTEAKRHVA